jgi:hypothetical protein
VTPEILINAPTGISWSTVPNFDSEPDAQLAEQINMCWRATHYIDSYCNQTLRATVNTEEILGPNYRLSIARNGLVRFQLGCWPVTEVLSAQYSSSLVAPAQWQTLPSNTIYIENPLDFNSGISIEAAQGSSAIRIVPGYIAWYYGRDGIRLQVQYVNGWSHAGIIAGSEVGDDTLSVDDTTGMINSINGSNVGRGMWIYDGANTEYVTIASTSTTSGAGTITTASPLLYPHNGSNQQPIIISCLPAVIQQAAIQHATYQAMVRGATATTVQNMPGATVGQTGGSATILSDAQNMLNPYRRVI